MNQKNLGAILDAATAMVGDVESISGLLEENARLRGLVAAKDEAFKKIINEEWTAFSSEHIAREALALTDAQQPADQKTTTLPVVGYISERALRNLQNPEWQMQRGASEHIWTINNPPSRAVIPLLLGPENTVVYELPQTQEK